MAEEENSGHVESSRTVETSFDRNSVLTTEERLEEEAGNVLRSPNDASSSLFRVEDANIYQTDVVEGAVEGETTTTEKPGESDVKEAPPATGTGETTQTAGETPTPAAETTAETTTAATASPAETAVDATTAATPAEIEKEGSLAAEVTEAPPSPASTEQVTTVPTTEVTTTSGPTKDPYAIEIPLDKKINKRTQRKLWEEIEKRKPLIPKHVAQHIQKYAKPPFETWSCKFRGKSTCFGCK